MLFSIQRRSTLLSTVICNTKHTQARRFHVHSCDRESWRHVCMHVHYNAKRLFLESDDVNHFLAKIRWFTTHSQLLDYSCSYSCNELSSIVIEVLMSIYATVKLPSYIHNNELQPSMLDQRHFRKQFNYYHFYNSIHRNCIVHIHHRPL